MNQSSKVDLYSAGIVFFEMLRRFSTGMERAVELNQLRYCTSNRWPERK